MCDSKNLPDASYYIMDHDHKLAHFYTNIGDHIKSVQMLESEHHYASSDRLDNLLDPIAKNIIRPHKIIVEYHIKLGKIISIHDKIGNYIRHTRYDGKPNKDEIAKYLQNAQFKIGIDVDWVLNNPVIIEDKYTSQTKAFCWIL